MFGVTATSSHERQVAYRNQIMMGVSSAGTSDSIVKARVQQLADSSKHGPE